MEASSNVITGYIFESNIEIKPNYNRDASLSEYLGHAGSEDGDADFVAPIAGIIFGPAGHIRMLDIKVFLEYRELG
jgi:hypothetical protein